MENASDQQENYNLWEGFIYLSFWIFANLFVLPNMPKTLTLNYYYPVSLIIYGTIGVFTGILVFRVIKDNSNLIKIAMLSIMYGLILYQLITHFEAFTKPGN